ncbi:hypothetical protein ACLOAV_010169 [Pseudogymnoascus australis]
MFGDSPLVSSRFAVIRRHRLRLSVRSRDMVPTIDSSRLGSLIEVSQPNLQIPTPKDEVIVRLYPNEALINLFDLLKATTRTQRLKWTCGYECTAPGGDTCISYEQAEIFIRYLGLPEDMIDRVERAMSSNASRVSLRREKTILNTVYSKKVSGKKVSRSEVGSTLVRLEPDRSLVNATQICAAAGVGRSRPTRWKDDNGITSSRIDRRKGLAGTWITHEQGLELCKYLGMSTSALTKAIRYRDDCVWVPISERQRAKVVVCAAIRADAGRDAPSIPGAGVGARRGLVGEMNSDEQKALKYLKTGLGLWSDCIICDLEKHPFVITCRHFLRMVLNSRYEEKGGDMEISAPTIEYAKKCICAMFYSAQAFWGIKGRLVVTNVWGTSHAYVFSYCPFLFSLSTFPPFPVMQVYGTNRMAARSSPKLTSTSQWGNAIVLHAAYMDPMLQPYVPAHELVELTVRVREFLVSVAHPRSALAENIRILDYAAGFSSTRAAAAREAAAVM